MIKKKLINEALQQMTGFIIGKWGADIIELTSSMGLTKKEWDYIKKNEESGRLDKKDIDKLDEYFDNHSPQTKSLRQEDNIKTANRKVVEISESKNKTADTNNQGDEICANCGEPKSKHYEVSVLEGEKPYFQCSIVRDSGINYRFKLKKDINNHSQTSQRDGSKTFDKKEISEEKIFYFSSSGSDTNNQGDKK